MRFEHETKAGMIAKFQADRNTAMVAQYQIMRPGVLVEFVGKHDPDFAAPFLASWVRLKVVEVSASGERGFVKLRKPGKQAGMVPLVREGGRWRLDFEPRRE